MLGCVQEEEEEEKEMSSRSCVEGTEPSPTDQQEEGEEGEEEGEEEEEEEEEEGRQGGSEGGGGDDLPLCHSAGEHNKPSDCRANTGPATHPPGSRGAEALLPSSASTLVTPANKKASLSLRRRGSKSDVRITKKTVEASVQPAGVCGGREGFVLGVMEEGEPNCLPDDDEESQFHIHHVSIPNDSQVSGSQNFSLEMVSAAPSSPERTLDPPQHVPASVLFASLRSGTTLRGGSDGGGVGGGVGGPTGRDLLGKRRRSNGARDSPQPSMAGCNDHFDFDEAADPCSSRELRPIKRVSSALSSTTPVVIANSEDPLGNEGGRRGREEGRRRRMEEGGRKGRQQDEGLSAGCSRAVAPSQQSASPPLMEEEESQPLSQSTEASSLCSASQPLKVLPEEDTTPAGHCAHPLPSLPSLPSAGEPATVAHSSTTAGTSRQLFPEPTPPSHHYHHLHHRTEPIGASSSPFIAAGPHASGPPASHSSLPDNAPSSSSSSSSNSSSVHTSSSVPLATPPLLPAHYTSPCARMTLATLQRFTSAIDSDCEDFMVRHVRIVKSVTTVVSTDIVRGGRVMPEFSTVETVDVRMCTCM